MVLTESGGGARDNEQYAVDTGGSGTGDTYSYGTAGATDRALGGLQSGTLIPLFGVFFDNNTGSTIASLTIAYKGEEWRLGTAGRTDQLDFQYSLDRHEFHDRHLAGLEPARLHHPGHHGVRRGAGRQQHRRFSQACRPRSPR